MFSRRHFLQSASALALAAFVDIAKSQAATALQYGPAKEFSFDQLIAKAKTMAGQTYVAPPRLQPEVTSKIDYEAHGKIQFKTDLALFAGQGNVCPVTFFHLGEFFQRKVTMNVVEGNTAREVLYSPDYFSMPKDSPARALKPDVGFAGFRFQESQSRGDWRTQDWTAFLGASYFRAIGDLNQYGLSARGLAVNVTAGGQEEFPDFREFFIEAPTDDNRMVVYALLDSASVTGAYKFILTRDKGVVMDVELRLFIRKDIAQLGVAPLTSMYWYSETRKPTMVDWRPEIHDSDGLQLLTGQNESLWRPLNNPPRTMTSSFADAAPKGFGLMQRDRNFEHYLDGVHYDKRPSLWVETKGDWGKGAVQLVEIPTDVEYHDNIVAMWVPEEKAIRGKEFRYSYRLHWQKEEPQPLGIGRVVATRLGLGREKGIGPATGKRKFMVEFLGPALAKLPDGAIPEPVITVSRGTLGEYKRTEAVPNDVAGHWRTQFDVEITGNEPVELRCFLKNGKDVLTETWSYQYHPGGPLSQ